MTIRLDEQGVLPEDEHQRRPAQYEVEVRRNVQIPVGDGEDRLAADLFLPVGASACPALVTVLPYLKDGTAGVAAWSHHHFFAERGFASLLVDFRGLGSSSGRPRPPFDAAEVDDGVAAIDWAAAQPWCNGRVGMWGSSYGAMIAMRTASRRPAALKAIMALEGATDLGSDMVHPGGARAALIPINWALGCLTMQLLPPLHFDEDGAWEHRWLRRLDDAEPYLLDLHRHPANDPVWDERNIDASQIDVPTFCVAGWRDYFTAASIRAFEQIPGPKRLLVGPWMHVRPEVSPFEPVDIPSLALRWWERWLLEVDNGVEQEPKAIVYVQGTGVWQALPAWPPRATETTLFAAAEGRLASDGAEVGTTEETRAVDPRVGAADGLWGPPLPGTPPPFDSHEDDLRAICFTSEPLLDPLEVIGAPSATIRLGPTSNGTCVVVKVSDVDRDGRSTLITTGTTARRRDGDPVLHVRLVPAAYHVPAGHRIRLTVAGGDFPRLWPDPRPATISVVCGRDPGASEVALTSVCLPVMPAGSTQPVDMPKPDPTAHLAPHTLRSDPHMELRRNPLEASVATSLGQRVSMRTTDKENVLDLDTMIEATVSQARPDAARVTGRSSARLSGGGRYITVRTDAIVTANLVVAGGEVEVDGTVVFSRRWTETVNRSCTEATTTTTPRSSDD